ncbi:MAG TPA: hypothetical protein VF768_12405, partial [Holophagaceae bacterium]
MRRLSALACVLALASILPLRAEIDARLMRYPDVSASQIAFTYAGDIWVVPKAGGLANRLSTPKGEESFARFSPDGRFLAFTGDYDGNPDVYVMPVEGGVPTRITHHPMPDRLVDWTPDGKSLIFASGMLSGRDRFNRLFEVSSGGGMPTAFPLPYGEFGALSPDGKVLAYQPISTEFRTWKRYRGGMTSEIWFYDLEKKTARRLPHGEGGSNDALPMWNGNTLYFLSDRDANKRNNLWSYDLKTGAFKQVTFFKEYDAHFPAIGPSDIVLEAGGKLYRVELPSEKLVEVKVEVATDQASLKPREGNASRFIRNVTLSPQGQRAVFEARGDLFSVPAEKGYVLDLTRTPGVGERFPALSPDGRQVAYFSDRSGDYELWVRPADGSGAERQVTHLGPGFRYTPTWSPDGKHVVFADQAMRINLCDVGTGKVTVVDKGLYMFEGPLENFRVSWSADSRWFAYLMDAENRNHVVVLYDTKEGKRHPVTSDFHDAGDVAFDPEGNYLFLLTGQHFDPTYSDLGDGTWVYTGTTRLAALPLRKDVASPLAPRNDADAAKADAKDSDTSEAKAKDAKKEPAEVGIDLDGLEGRMVLLPPKAGFLSDLAAVKGKVVYRRTGPPDAEADVPQAGRGTLQYYDLSARKEMTVIEGVDGSLVAAGGEKVLVQQRQDFAVLDLKPDQKIEKKLPTGELMMPLDPRAEWRQIFNDAWRQERDFFYDPGMHGLDWPA